MTKKLFNLITLLKELNYINYNIDQVELYNFNININNNYYINIFKNNYYLVEINKDYKYTKITYTNLKFLLENFILF